jgi:hypothetical protein
MAQNLDGPPWNVGVSTPRDLISALHWAPSFSIRDHCVYCADKHSPQSVMSESAIIH